MRASDFTIRQDHLQTHMLIFKSSGALSLENVKTNLVDDDFEIALDDPTPKHLPHVRS